MRKLEGNQQEKIIQLRMKGRSIPEISRETGIAKTTIQRYVKDIQVPPEFLRALKEKQGGSKQRSQSLRENLLEEASALAGTLSERDYFMLLVGLYWGEGTKRDFNIVNSDPQLLQTFLVCLLQTGIGKDRISISLRVHNNIPVSTAKAFWSKTLQIPITAIRQIEIIEGKKKGKVPYGMCRIRVRAGIRERLRVQSAISVIGKSCDKKLLSQSLKALVV